MLHDEFASDVEAEAKARAAGAILVADLGEPLEDEFEVGGADADSCVRDGKLEEAIGFGRKFCRDGDWSRPLR